MKKRNREPEDSRSLKEAGRTEQHRAEPRSDAIRLVSTSTAVPASPCQEGLKQ